MTEILKLHNQIKHYEWGSTQILPGFLGIENTGKPCAELWMGTNPGAPSQVEIDGKLLNLKDVCGELPFLFKLIAVEKPLSVQAHPNKEQAEKGFAREEKSGISIKAPTRNYKDSNHKPEVVCAITPFTLMAGFRKSEDIYKSLEAFLKIAPPLKDILKPLLYAFEGAGNTAVSASGGPIMEFFRTLFNFSRIHQEYLCTYINEKTLSDSSGVITDEQCKLMKYFSALYPWDSAIITPLFLNLITLQPGQAMFIPAGVLHAHLNGFALELMTSSDNVLRGGLTCKHIDVGELMNIVNFVPFIPRIITPPDNEQSFYYDTPQDEFLLANIQGSSEKSFIRNCPAICIVTEGEMKTCGRTFKKGESFFIPKESEKPVFEGKFSLFAASASSGV